LPAMAPREDIQAAISACYGEQGMTQGSDNFGGSGAEVGIDDLATRLFSEDIQDDNIDEKAVTESDNTLVQLVNKMILDAYRDGVSDIHIETYPEKKNTILRRNGMGQQGHHRRMENRTCERRQVHAVPQQGLRTLQQDRLQRPPGPV